MYGRILVGVDGSETSDVALAEALRLAKEQHAKLRLVHVADIMPPAGLESTHIDYDLFRDSALRAGREFMDHAQSLARRADLEQDAESAVIEARAHDISDGIVGEAARWRADLVVMGTHGRGGLERLLLGSVAESVARHAPVPVLLVRGPAAKTTSTAAQTRSRTTRGAAAKPRQSPRGGM